MTLPSVLVIVLSFNTKDDTLECLASLTAEAVDGVAVVVVDNGSSDGAADAIRTAFPDIEIIALGENRGWASGNNVGIQVALKRGFDFVCLLNNDTIISPGTFRRLRETAQILGPCILHPAIDYYDPPGEPQLDASLGVPRTARYTPVPERNGVFKMDSDYGACMVVAAEIFRRVGLIDERFFIQLEETEFGQRASRAGFAAYCDSAARIKHKESRAYGGRRTPVKTYYIVRNSLLLCEMQRRGLRPFLATARHLVWTLWGISEWRAGSPKTRAEFLAWTLSRDPFAVAARMAAVDYLRRRFGPLRHPQRLA